MPLRLTILGSGTSHGIPMIDCDCPVCTSDDPRDHRNRTSALFSYDNYHVLIDTAPELRLQCIAFDVRQVDAILITHTHADHVAGMDDVRRFSDAHAEPLGVYGKADTLDRVCEMFGYAFIEQNPYPSAVPRLRARPIDGPVELFGRQVIPIPYMHGEMVIFGYRIGDVAYCPDCSAIPDASRPLLEGLDVLVLDALRRRPHPTHFNLDQALEEAQRIGARRTYFTHIAHELRHAETDAALPDGISMAYDGLVIESG